LPATVVQEALLRLVELTLLIAPFCRLRAVSCAAVTTSVDETMNRIMMATAAYQRGEVAEAKEEFARLWREIGPDGDPLHVVTLAHFVADAQDDPAARLEWDLRALAAVDGLTDERARSYHASLSVRSFYPSLHANVADNYAQLGDLRRAREHLTKARSYQHLLSDDNYGALVRSYLDKVETRLAAAAVSSDQSASTC
jgi:hypothetical protein